MHVGIFIEEMRQGATHADAFQEGFQLVDQAEAWGLDGVWLGELHCLPARSVLSAPLVVAAAIAARTRRLRIGTAVHVLPLSHPLRVAEEVATLDHVSEGRVEFGVGRSGAVRTYDTFGIPYTESQARFREALAIVREAWKGAPFSYHGTHFRVDGATVSPRPYQRPHPPLRMAATTEETFPEVGRLGLAIFVGLRGMSVTELATHVRAYRAAWRDAGHEGAGSVYLRIPIYAAPSEAEATEEPRESATYYFQRQAEMARAALGRAGTGPADRRQAQADELARLSYAEILRSRVAFGTAPQLVERLAALRAELSLDGVVVELNPGGLIPRDRAAGSFRILAHEVVPALR